MNKSPSVDPREVAHFQSIADTWWQPDGPFWPLHLLNKTRVQYLVDQLGVEGASPQQPLTGLRVLDVGCGGGILAESLVRLGAEVTGVDVVERNIEIARLHATQNELTIDYRVSSVEQLQLSEERPFDVVLNMEVVEHVADLDGFMAACGALVRPGGSQVVATINRNPWAWFTAVLMAERVLRLLPVGTHHWAKLRKPSEISALLQSTGFAVSAQTGVRVDPFRRRMSLTSSMAINFMLVAQKAVE